jgi:hypothetical protein
MASTNSRARAQAYRHSPEGKQARRMYEATPEVKLKNAIRRAIKQHRPPPKST